MATKNYVVVPRVATEPMKSAYAGEFASGYGLYPRGIREDRAYRAMFAAIPDDPAAPIPVGRDEWGRIKRDAERWRKWQDRRKEHIIAKERGT